MLDGRGSGIVLQPDTLRWFTERSNQNPANLSTSTRWVQYLDADDQIVHREQRTWSYTVLGHLLPGAAGRLRHGRYVLGEYRLRIRSERATARPSGSSAAATETADLVVFADGITSMARERLDPEPPLTYSGYIGWRGTVPEHDPDRHAPESCWPTPSATRGSALAHHPLSDSGRKRRRTRRTG